MVTESEGYETIRKALGMALKETERQLNEVIAQKDKCVEAQTGHILYNKTEIARLEGEIKELEAEMSKISQPFDEKICAFQAESKKIMETAKQIVTDLAKCGKPDIAKKVQAQPMTVDEQKMVASVVADFEPKKSKKQPGSAMKRAPSKKILDIVENFLVKEAKWQTRQSVGDILVAEKYPSKFADLYASKALNELKRQGKVVSFSNTTNERRVFWRHAKFPNLNVKEIKQYNGRL